MWKCAWLQTSLRVLQAASEHRSAGGQGHAGNQRGIGRGGRQVHAVQNDQKQVTLFIEAPTASSQRIREKQGIRVI